MTDTNTRLSATPVRTGRSENDNTPDHPKGRRRLQPKVEVVKTVTKKKKEGTDKLNKLMAYLDSIRGQNFTGYIKVNFSQGSIGRIERFEEILRK
jgi:hypothetical protein